MKSWFECNPDSQMSHFQDMQSCFPGCPEAVILALLDLYKQVLAHIEVHSQVGFTIEW